MKPSVLREVLVKAFESRQNILITGAPGIGKSDIVNQSCLTFEETVGSGGKSPLGEFYPNYLNYKEIRRKYLRNKAFWNYLEEDFQSAALPTELPRPFCFFGEKTKVLNVDQNLV